MFCGPRILVGASGADGEDERAPHYNLESRSPPTPRQSSIIFGEFLVSLLSLTSVRAR
jgi:hypothetical protein